MDYVFFVPPPSLYTGRKRDFEVDLHTCWYGHVVVLIRIKVKSDSSQIWECDCDMIDVLIDLKPAGCKGITLFRVSLPNVRTMCTLEYQCHRDRCSHKCAQFALVC